MLKNQLATENTEFTEEKQLAVGNVDFSQQVNKKIKGNLLYLCVLCDLCGLNCGF